MIQKGVSDMTNMKRTSISFPDELAERIFALRKNDRFTRYSYSELVRQLAEYELQLLEDQTADGQDEATAS